MKVKHLYIISIILGIFSILIVANTFMQHKQKNMKDICKPPKAIDYFILKRYPKWKIMTLLDLYRSEYKKKYGDFPEGQCPGLIKGNFDGRKGKEYAVMLLYIRYHETFNARILLIHEYNKRIDQRIIWDMKEEYKKGGGWTFEVISHKSLEEIGWYFIGKINKGYYNSPFEEPIMLQYDAIGFQEFIYFWNGKQFETYTMYYLD